MKVKIVRTDEIVALRPTRQSDGSAIAATANGPDRGGREPISRPRAIME